MPEKLEISVEKLVYGGEGLGFRDGPVLVSRVLPGERVEAEPVRSAKGVVHARPIRIVESSADRRSPPCPYFGKCGGCHYQHIPAELQVEFKKKILRETLWRTGKVNWHGDIPCHSGEEWKYRNRARFQIQPRAEGGAKIGFFEPVSHELCSLDACLILSPKLNEIFEALKSYFQYNFPAGCKEIEAAVNEEDTELILTLRGHLAKPAQEEVARELRREIPGVRSIGIEIPREPPTVFGSGSLDYTVCGFRYQVSHGSFFQASRYLLPSLVGSVVGAEKGRIAVDLYAGVGLFTLPLAKKFDTVYAVESHGAAANDLQTNVRTHGLKNIKVIQESTLSFLRRFWGGDPSLLVLDPPRRGAGPKVLKSITALRPERIVYCSCDPATLARDLHDLLGEGYELVAVELFDLFPQTYHMEALARLQRTN